MSRILTIEEIIKLGDITVPLSFNYEEFGKIFGGRLSDNLPTTVAIVTDALRWQNDSFPNTDAVNAKGYIEILTNNPLGGINITVLVDDPDYGILLLGTYTQQPGDDVNTIVTNIITALSTNPYGYTISRINNNIVIEAREGLGSQMNSGNRLIVILSSRIFNYTFDNTFN